MLALFLTFSTALFAPTAKEAAAEKKRMQAVKTAYTNNPNASVGTIATITGMKAGHVRTAKAKIDQEKQDQEDALKKAKHIAAATKEKPKAPKKGKKK